MIGIDGQHRTKVPVNASGSEGCATIWWNSPKGTEIVYREPGDPLHWGRAAAALPAAARPA